MKLTLSDARTDGWLEAIDVRRSRRRYDGTPVLPADLDAIQVCIDGFRPTASGRVVLLRQAPSNLFKGLVGSYGRIEGVSSAMVFVGREGDLAVQEAIGYLGEGLVLEATRLGLTTCWVGGFFKSSVANAAVGIQAGERAYAVTPVGHAAEHIPQSERLIYGAGRTKPRKSLDEIAPGHESWPAWAQEGVRAAQVAPSAMHRQPWRFRMDDGELVVGYEGADTPKVSKRLDCGIAMMHVELAARAEGVFGAWDVGLADRDVARFVPDTHDAE